MPLASLAGPLDNSGTAEYGPYAVSTTQEHQYGRRMITWDGKVFKYCHSLGTLYCGYGAFNGANATVARLINSVTPAAIVAGDKKTTITIAATEGYAGDGVIALNELAGSQIVLGHGAAALTEQRTIVTNTVGASGGGTITVEVDYPFVIAHAAGVACEIPMNPYRYTVAGGTSYAAVMCVPNYPATTGYNYWGQTWGPCWCVPGGGDASPGDTASDRMAFFVGDGSVNFGTSLTVETGYQPAGFCIDTTASGTSAMPLIMLQISI